MPGRGDLLKGMRYHAPKEERVIIVRRRVQCHHVNDIGNGSGTMPGLLSMGRAREVPTLANQAHAVWRARL